MRRFIMCLILISLPVFGCTAGDAPKLSTGSWAATSLPPCATDGDMDGDGKPDSSDVSRADACDDDPYGLCEDNCDCATGEGDGLDDCVAAP